MIIFVIVQFVLGDLFTIQKDEVKTLFSLPIQAQHYELTSFDDNYGICLLQGNSLQLQRQQYDNVNITNIAMIALSPHSTLVLTNDHQLNYIQDSNLLWQFELPDYVYSDNLVMKYHSSQYQVYLISDKVYVIYPYEIQINQPQLFLNQTIYQLESCDIFLFVLVDQVITIYNEMVYNQTITFQENSKISQFSVIKINQTNFIITLIDENYGIQQIQWSVDKFEIYQIDFIQNGKLITNFDTTTIFVVYQRQSKYILTEYQLIESKYQIVKKIYSKIKINKIIASKDFLSYSTKNQIRILHKNILYSIHKFGIKDFQQFGTKIIGLNIFQTFSYIFELIPAKIICFSFLEHNFGQFSYSLNYSIITTTIEKIQKKFEISNPIIQKNDITYIIISGISGFMLIVIGVVSYKNQKQQNLIIKQLQTIINQQSIKQIPLFKSLECVVSPKAGQHSKLQSFDQTSNFDLIKIK